MTNLEYKAGLQYVIITLYKSEEQEYVYISENEDLKTLDNLILKIGNIDFFKNYSVLEKTEVYVDSKNAVEFVYVENELRTNLGMNRVYNPPYITVKLKTERKSPILSLLGQDILEDTNPYYMKITDELEVDRLKSYLSSDDVLESIRSAFIVRDVIEDTLDEHIVVLFNRIDGQYKKIFEDVVLERIDKRFENKYIDIK